MFVFPGPQPFAWPPTLVLAPNLHLPSLAPNSYLPALAPYLHLPALTPNLYLPALTPHLVFTSPGTKFEITGPDLHLVFTPNFYLPDQLGVYRKRHIQIALCFKTF